MDLGSAQSALIRSLAYPKAVTFSWDEDRFGNKINVPIDDFNHLMDAMRYGLEDVLVGPTFSFD